MDTLALALYAAATCKRRAPWPRASWEKRVPQIQQHGGVCVNHTDKKIQKVGKAKQWINNLPSGVRCQRKSASNPPLIRPNTNSCGKRGSSFLSLVFLFCFSKKQTMEMTELLKKFCFWKCSRCKSFYDSAAEAYRQQSEDFTKTDHYTDINYGIYTWNLWKSVTILRSCWRIEREQRRNPGTNFMKFFFLLISFCLFSDSFTHPGASYSKYSVIVDGVP